MAGCLQRLCSPSESRVLVGKWLPCQGPCNQVGLGDSVLVNEMQTEIMFISDLAHKNLPLLHCFLSSPICRLKKTNNYPGKQCVKDGRDPIGLHL